MDPVSRREFLTGAPARHAAARVLEACLPVRGIDCQLCRDACDARALTFLPVRGAPARPVIDPALCTACNDCVALCPVDAIRPGTPAA